MNEPTKAQLKKATETIRRIIQQPSIYTDEFRQRVSGVDPAAGRMVVLGMILNDKTAARERDAILMLAETFGLGKDPDPLLDLIQDEGAGDATRRVALLVLIATNPAALGRMGSDLDPELMAGMAREADAMVLRSVLEDPDDAAEITAFFLGLPPENREFAFEHLDRSRKGMMVPAWITYIDLLAEEQLEPLHEAVIAAISLETRATDVDVWDELMDLDLAPETRNRVQAELMRRRTSLLNTGGAATVVARPFTAVASAWISECDGVGAYVVMVRVELENGGVHLLNTCLRTTGELRDGFVLADRQPQEWDEILEMLEMESEITFTRLPLARATELVAAARVSPLNESTVGMDLNLRAAAILQWATVLGDGDKTDLRLTAATAPEPAVADTDLPRLFDEPELDTWFLNAADLVDLKVEAVRPPETDDAWLAERLDRINTPHIREHLASLFRHMAWYHLWRDDRPAATRYAGAAELLADEETAVPVLRPYLERSLDIHRREEESDDGTEHYSFGDPVTRENLRLLCFPRLTRPKGKHMAILDLTEAALTVVEIRTADFAIDRQPRQDALPQIALAIAKAEVDMLLAGGSGYDLPDEPKRFRRMINAIRKHSGLTADEAAELWTDVMPQLNAFVFNICGNCPVQCLRRPTGDMSEWFNLPVHPAMEEEFGSMFDS